MTLDDRKYWGQYQRRDWDVVDYESFELPDFRYTLRGPQPHVLEPKGYGAVVGAAQSFGVLVRKPYHHRLAEFTDLPILNLSVGGSAPVLFLNNNSVVDYCNRARFCIIQVLSARSSANSYFETRDGKNMMRPRGSDLPYVPGDTAFHKMFEYEPIALCRAVINEIRANWVNEMTRLLHSISAPKILLWFSKRNPDDVPSEYTQYREAAGVYPQLVNRDMVEAVRRYADHYVECVTNSDMPHKLINRFTGEPALIALGDKKEMKSEDGYYPSPAMHDDAFEMLKGPVAQAAGLRAGAA